MPDAEALKPNEPSVPGTRIREIWLTNSMSGRKEKLVTRVPGELSMYSCGPTVYNLIHIGNLRAALTADVLYRYFRRAGYEVRYVRNYTDIDDKIIQRGKDEGVGAAEIARKYTQEVEKDYAVAGLAEPTHKPTALGTLPEIIGLVRDIIDRGHGYVVDGEVFFSIESFKEYGKLSGRNLDELIAGQRVEINDKKRNPLDFSLWKPAKPGEPSWESPWGAGRPGWHIECSAMARKCVGDHLDVHHGGEDLIFPHHENEIAQAEAGTGNAPFVRFWVHNRHLHINSAKMSKSLGNVFLARDFLARYGTDVARYVLLSVHYRSIIDFSDESIEQALTGLERIYEAKKAAVALTARKYGMSDMHGESLWGEFVADCEKTRKEIDDAYANDLNTAGALAALFTLIRHFNRLLREPKAMSAPSAMLGAQLLIGLMEQDIGEVIGVGRMDAENALARFASVRALRTKARIGSSDGAAATGVPQEDEILRLIEERKQARASKDFARSDEIRKDLDARGVVLKDSPQGTTWSYK